ncbi:outer membrane protein [Martelella mangrovi]|uniref:Outer membrane immunogenic protein n=1 Tax=Martelella mangrovi TaxID=1397477 RepID=A0ABV2IGE3_9HYPH
MRKIALITLASLMSGVSANAADIIMTPVPQQEVPPMRDVPTAFNWQGFYVGGVGGWVWTEAEPNTFRIRQSSLDSNNGLIGGFVGYNYQFENNFVLGVEGELDYNFGADDQNLDVLLNGSYQPMNGKLDLQWGGSIRARAGYAFDQALIYATGGWEVVGARLKASGPGGSIDTDDQAFNGWTIGAGAEYAFTKNLFGRVEYRYSHFPKVDHPFGFDNSFSVKSHQNRVQIGLGYSF